jgi:hypothetical protein
LACANRFKDFERATLDGSLLCYSIAEEVCQARAAELIGE